MEQRELNELLNAVAAGELSPEDAAVRLRVQPFSDLGFAKVDHHRGIRQGVSEVVYGSGKTPDQIAAIVADMPSVGQKCILITRLAPDAARQVEQLLSEGLVVGDAAEDGVAADDMVAGCTAEDGTAMVASAVAGDVAAACATEDASVDPSTNAPSAASDTMPDTISAAMPDGIPAASDRAQSDEDIAAALPLFTYYDLPQVAIVGGMPEPDGKGNIVVACGGTSDIYAAEEAALTAEVMGNEVVRLYDVGVAGLHRLLAHADELAQARVIVAVAGMEGALPSVIGGLASCPVIAVPTSVGYGASLDGLAALLAMLNSCASGVSVVNIDNGFGAGYQASLINHL